MFLPSTMTLKFGDAGDFVTELQRRLTMVGCFSEAMINGYFDGPTVNGVIAFQGRHGLHADGVAGPETLRRLSGVITGDTGSSAPTGTTEEEAKPVPPQPQGFTWGSTPAEPAPVAAFMAAEAAATSSYAAEMQPTAVYTPPPPAPAPMFEPQPPQPAQSYDMLAALAQTAPQPQHARPEHGPMPVSERPPLTGAGGAVPLAAITPVQMAVPAATPQPPALEQQAPAPQGFLDKAVRFANTMVQKLADYFEAKLPPSVLREVQSIGQFMAREGVREVPIPGEVPTRTADLPARAPEHTQTRG